MMRMLTTKASPHLPEHELLLCCATTEANENIVSRLRKLSSSAIDWEYLFKIARRHSVLPLVYTKLQAHAADLIPHAAAAQFRQAYQENFARNLVLTAELLKLVRVLADAGIDSIPFKGPLLALLAYNDLSLRRYVDLDLIIKKDDVFRARDVLKAAGYETSKALSAEHQSILVRTQHSIPLKQVNGRVVVELHWEVVSDLFAAAVSAKDLWQRRIEVELNGQQLKSLSPDDLLFSLCVHGSKHIWERLAWICDVAELIKRQPVDWSALRKRAARTDCERMFYLGLLLANRLLDADLPDDVKSYFGSDRQLQTCADNITARLFSGIEPVPPTSAQTFRFNFNLRKSWRSRARYFAFTLQPTDGDFGELKLPRPFYFAYYLLRPVRLLMSDRR